ncbi:hypothetical protein DFH07DRAFT_732520 [Mycena maculata]|uniref:Uncharacterized protein n=1 Tax=Mycena maculata TaxID=230809 RepID=A0AAD7JY99_9AGAR|nr:hypothetical protein DFH07DRAFT_732520 [Mycena maculata]
MQAWVYCEPHLFVSRSLTDLATFRTGIGAYYLHETHPRTGIEPHDRLTELVKWKWAKYWAQREERARP